MLRSTYNCDMFDNITVTSIMMSLVTGIACCLYHNGHSIRTTCHRKRVMVRSQILNNTKAQCNGTNLLK